MVLALECLGTYCSFFVNDADDLNLISEGLSPHSTWEDTKARNMCKIFSLVPSKTCHQRKLRQTKCLLFNFLNVKIHSYTTKSHLALGHLAKFVFWSILSKILVKN